MKYIFLIVLSLVSSGAFAEMRDDVRNVIREHLREVRNCYEAELKSSPKLSGKVIVEWDIDPNGKVLSTRIIKSLAPKVDECLEEAIRTWTFPKRKDDGLKTNIRYPFVFSPN